ncbi:MAG: FkbM family methyltransferase [Alphaproteobacteria bacterium]|nr:FkbM family methyltransferase [Alphaproteobacteria bacterium]
MNMRVAIVDGLQGTGTRFMLVAGPDSMTHYVFQQGIYEPEPIKLAKALIGDSDALVLDIGANMGSYVIPLAKVCPNARFVCFEAQRPVYYQLCGNIFLNGLQKNVQAVQVALGNPEKEGETIEVPFFDLATNKYIGSTSLIPDKTKFLPDLPAPMFNETLPLKKLDDLIQEHVSLIKLDVEGMEYDVLMGARDLIKKDKPYIILECHQPKNEFLEQTANDIKQLMADLNYNMYTLFDNQSYGNFLGIDASKDDGQATRLGMQKGRLSA